MRSLSRLSVREVDIARHEWALADGWKVLRRACATGGWWLDPTRLGEHHTGASSAPGEAAPTGSRLASRARRAESVPGWWREAEALRTAVRPQPRRQIHHARIGKFITAPSADPPLT